MSRILVSNDKQSKKNKKAKKKQLNKVNETSKTIDDSMSDGYQATKDRNDKEELDNSDKEYDYEESSDG